MSINRYTKDQLLEFFRHHDPAMLPSIDAIMHYPTEKLAAMMTQVSSSLPDPTSVPCVPEGA
jgi:hypothetical protein